MAARLQLFAPNVGRFDLDLRRFARRGFNFEPAFRLQLKAMRRILADKFGGEGTDNSGAVRWAPLAPETIRRRQFPGKPILEQTGRLKRSFQRDGADGYSRVNRHGWLLASRVEYALVHQTGNRAGNLPARRMIDPPPGRVTGDWRDLALNRSAARDRLCAPRRLGPQGAPETTGPADLAATNGGRLVNSSHEQLVENVRNLLARRGGERYFHVSIQRHHQLRDSGSRRRRVHGGRSRGGAESGDARLGMGSTRDPGRAANPRERKRNVSVGGPGRTLGLRWDP